MKPVFAILAGVMAGIAPVTAMAATLLALSAGEHGGFSRIAIPLGGDQKWTSTQNGRTVTIVLPGITGSVDTGAVFPRRAAHRVLDVAVSQSARSTELTFTLSCACTAKVYGWKGRKIVMDIRDTSPAASPRTAPPKHPKQPAADAAPAMKVTPLDIEKARADLMERLQAAAEVGVVQMTRSVMVENAAPAGMTSPPMAATGEGTAMEPGASVPEQPMPPANPEITKDMATDQPTPAASMARSVPPAADAPPATSLIYGNEIAGNARKNCLADSQLKLGAWRSREPFAQELPVKRAALLGEFDTLNAKNGVALAQFYLAYGLGEEAALIAREFVPADTPQLALLSDLAEIFRGRKIAIDGPILGAGQCEGSHALWQAAALALNENWQDAARAERRSGDALAQLPRNIRIPLGVNIAQAALNAGQMEQVRRILALLRRSGSIASPALDLVEGKFALAEDNQPRARRLLDPLTRSTHPEAVEATLVLSRAQLISPGYISEERLIDLALIAMERRYTPLGREALILTAWAQTAAGRPEAALDILSREADSSSLETEKAELRREISRTLLDLYKPGAGQASLEDTDLFWRYQAYLDDNQTTQAIRRGAARNLMARGLPNAALSLLSRPGVEDGPPLLLAEALMAAGRPAQVLATLAPFAGNPESLEIRSKALAQLGRYGAAASLIPEASRDPVLLKLKADLLWADSQWAAAARLYARLGEDARPADLAAINRRLTAATFMAGDEALTRDTLRRLGASDDTGLTELLMPSSSPSLTLPEQVDQSLRTAQTVSRLLKELLSDG